MKGILDRLFHCYSNLFWPEDDLNLFAFLWYQYGKCDTSITWEPMIVLTCQSITAGKCLKLLSATLHEGPIHLTICTRQKSRVLSVKLPGQRVPHLHALLIWFKLQVNHTTLYIIYDQNTFINWKHCNHNGD